MRKIFILLTLVTVFGVATTNNLLALTNANATIGLVSDGMTWDEACGGRGNFCGYAVTADVRVDKINNPTLNNAYNIAIEFKKISNTMGMTLTAIEQFTFPENFKMKITQCDDYPTLLDQIVDLSNKTVAINGVTNIQLVIE